MDFGTINLWKNENCKFGLLEKNILKNSASTFIENGEVEKVKSQNWKIDL